MIVVDQMRADYVDKFRGQWNGGLKRLLDEGAWYRAAGYPYAATETCPGHATISTGAFPASHGMVANAWWDREAQKMITCTSDPNAKNAAYAGGTTKGGDSAWRMRLPSFAEELKFQLGGSPRVVTFSLKARAAITMAGHKADAATWFDSGTGVWVTSSAYGTMPFLEDFAKKHPVNEDYGKTWSPFLGQHSYWYNEQALGAGTLAGWTTTFPHPLRGKEATSTPNAAFYEQWATSPFADSYLTKMAEVAVDSLGLEQRYRLSRRELFHGGLRGAYLWATQLGDSRHPGAIGQRFGGALHSLGPESWAGKLCCGIDRRPWCGADTRGHAENRV
jgi:hypothetical protein